jgi:hypothetical protein
VLKLVQPDQQVVHIFRDDQILGVNVMIFFYQILGINAMLFF